MANVALGRLRAAGIDIDAVETRAPGEATRLARDAYARGERQFLAVGGDGTAEIVNGLFPEAASGERPSLGFLPLGTGNSFLRDFTNKGAEHAVEAIVAGRPQRCDVLRLTHTTGTVYFINLLSMGFTADVTAAANRRFKWLGELGYVCGVLISLARLSRRAFPLRANGDSEMDGRRCLFLSLDDSPSPAEASSGFADTAIVMISFAGAAMSS